MSGHSSGAGSGGGGVGGRSFAGKGAAPSPGHKEDNKDRSLPAAQGRSGGRSADRYRSGDRLVDPARDRSTADRSQRGGRSASRERSTTLDRPALSVGLRKRSEDDRSTDRYHSGDRLGDSFADRSRDAANHSRRREGTASRERAALGLSALSIGSRKRSADDSGNRFQDRAKSDRSRDVPVLQERALTQDQHDLSIESNSRSKDNPLNRSGDRLGVRADDSSADQHRYDNRFGERCRGRSADRARERPDDRYRSGDRLGDRYADRSDDRSFRRQDRPASRERTPDRSARRSQYGSEDLYGSRSRDDSRDRFWGAPGSQAPSRAAAPRVHGRAASNGGGSGGDPGWSKGDTREQDRGWSRMERDDRPAGKGEWEGRDRSGGEGGGRRGEGGRDSGASKRYRGSGGSGGGDGGFGGGGDGDGDGRDRKRGRTSGSPSTATTNNNNNYATTTTLPASEASRGDSHWVGGTQGVKKAAAVEVARRHRSSRLLSVEDGFLSSSDSDRSCSPGPAVRRNPRDENASAWDEETVSPFRRLRVSDRREERRGGQGLRYQQEQQQQQQQYAQQRLYPQQQFDPKSSASWMQEDGAGNPRIGGFSDREKRGSGIEGGRTDGPADGRKGGDNDECKQQQEEEEEPQLPNHILGNKPDFKAEGGGIGDHGEATQREEAWGGVGRGWD